MSTAAMDAHMRERADSVAQSLVGTCHALSSYAMDIEVNNTVFTKRLDELVFECAQCGWWCEDDERAGNVGDEDGEDICEECKRG